MSNECEREGCKEYPMICLNGIEWLCWSHYCETVQDSAQPKGPTA